MKGVSMSMRKTGLKKIKEAGRLHNMSTVGVCFSSILFHILGESQIGAAVRKDSLALMVESGNKNNAEIQAFFDKYSKHPTFESILRSLSFIPKTHCRAIQVSDFFAFYSRRHMREMDRFSGKMIVVGNFYLKTIKNNVPVWDFLSPGFEN